jgi:arsenate reductase
MRTALPTICGLLSIFFADPCGAAVALQSGGAGDLLNQKRTVVFVCEHGAAQSVIAAAYFNKLADERHLPFRAVARGTSPQEKISVSATQGLHTDGVATSEQSPTKLTTHEADRAVRVVTFLKLPSEYYVHAKVEQWSDVPAVAEGYGKTRDLIVGHVNALLRELQK